MHNEKRISMEDTWPAAELKRHLSRRKDEHDRKHRGGDSPERRHRDPDRESTDRHGDRRDTRKGDRKEDRERRKERDRPDRHGHDFREDKDKRRHEKDRLREGHDEEDGRRRREDKERRREERDRERRIERDSRTQEGRDHREGDKDLEQRREDKDRRREERDRERRIEKDRRTQEERDHREGDIDRRREDKERRREEREREHRIERDRKTQEERNHREGDKERRREDRDRQEDRKHLRAEREQHRKHREERETRHKDRRHHDERRRRDTEEGAEAVRHPRGGEELAERDRRKERRHREDPERHSTDGYQDKQSHSQETRRGKKPQENERHSGDVAAKEAGDTQEPVAIEESLQQYEDDFEDYEEDFEELDDNEKGGEEEEEEAEVKAIQRAMGEENQRVRASFSTLLREEEEKEKMAEVKGSAQKPSTSSQRGKFMDFLAARQREVIKKVSSKQKKRSAELLRLIDLDLSTTLSLLDLPPVSEYDMYIRNFGAANTKQAYVQCNEDNVDRDVQTEEIDISDKWTQHPAEHCGACGDPYGSHDTRDISGMNLDSRRLAAFLRSASQVMVVLLEEDYAQKTSFKGRSTQTDMLSFSDGSVKLNTKLPFLAGRTISMLQFSPTQRHTLLSVHQPASSPSTVVQLDYCSVICIWRIWEPSRPQKILLVESQVTCCCFSPGKSTLVFAGTSIGSVLLWDLREPDGDHKRLKVGEDEWTFRRPTFSTDALPAAHFSSVASVEVVPASVPGRPGSEFPFLASEEELLGLSFQLASLDERGLFNLWVVLQLPKANEAGSQTDLGLRPGGKVKLLHSSSCVTSEGVWPWLADKSVPLQTLALKFFPTDCSHFFIGTSMGLVRHGTTQGLKAPPKFYSSQEFGARLVDVIGIHFSPFQPCLFLVGCGDGSVRLHQVSCDKPVAEWTDSTAGEAVVSLQWSQTRPAVFCVLDATSNLHLWDLLKKDSGPLVTERMDRLTAMAAFGDPGQQNAYSGIATAQQSGKIEMHYFTHDFSLPSHEEAETVERIFLT